MINFSIFLSVIASMGVIAATLSAPALPHIADHFSAHIATVQCTLSLFLVGNALGQLFSGILSDRIGQRKVMLGGLILFIASSCMAALVDTMALLLAARFFQGMGTAVGPVLARAIAASRFPSNRSAELQSYGAFVIGFASMIAILASGYLSLFSWRNNFWLAALFGSVMFIWAMATLKPTASSPANRRPLFQLFRQPIFLSNTLCHSLTYGLMYGYIGTFPFLLIHYLQQNDPSKVGQYSACMIGCYMVGALLNSRLVRGRDPQRMVVLGIALQAISGLLLALCNTTPFFFMALALFNVSIGIILPATSACALAASKDSTGAASSVLGLSYRFIGSLLSTAVTMLPLGAGFSLGLTIAMLSLVSMAIVWFWVYRIKVDRFQDDPTRSWEERYNALHEHHIKETSTLLAKIRNLKSQG